ncbi:MFS transporter [Natrinema salsiterrestre]|uniref:dolichyl-phosphooligosaccharide-protein glycotransferase n=1 Tax=Natrinema salsiterrestre TaxID=2950540 RepID=A0A9Q4PZD3_9EURY|nr:MFS transporter [Natrinema salsiterrestre]MDF9743999.1 MFS transporter [Natrinema salsiterrestre]
MADEPDPATVADATATFCEEYESGERALETVLEVDAERDTWCFDDLPLDSGTFGELVSRGIVTAVGDEYRVASRRGVRAGLDGEPVSEDRSASGFDLSVPIAFDPRAAVGLVGALVLVFVMRSLNYRSVVRGDHVVSPANDPYYYRYWLEELLAESSDPTDWSVVTNLPEGAAELRPFTHAANWFAAALLGGDQWAANTVAVWLPVVMAVALGAVVYWLTVVVTDDVRVGIAAVVMLALTPVHAVYTGLGFLEHRLYQYVFMGVTLLALAWLAVDFQRRFDRDATPETATRAHRREPATWVAAGALGIALAVSVHAWGGSILLLVPVAGYIGLKVIADIRAGLSPLLTNGPLLAGIGLGGALIVAMHVHWGWHEPLTSAVSLLVVAGAVNVVGLGELWRRLEWPAIGLLGSEALVAGVALVAFRSLRPDTWARLAQRAGELFYREGMAETKSILALENGVVFGPLSQFGLGFYLGILVLGWACWAAYRRYEPRWLLLAVYGAFWLALAAIQGRFAAQLAIPLSVLGGLGFVWLLAWADLVREPALFRDGDESGLENRGEGRGTAADGGERSVPSIVVPTDTRTLVALLWIGLLVCGLNLFFVPSMLAQTTHSDAQFDAAMAIDDHAEDVGRESPETYVLSHWGDNRMYNYFVNGGAERYSYARQNFGEFRAGDDPDGWYHQFNNTDVGYVVVTDSNEYDATSTYARLHDELGAGGEDGPPLEHYRAVFVDDEVTAFAVVPGATIIENQPDVTDPNETVAIETEVVVSGEAIPYERTVTPDSDGRVVATVPYPGEYTVGETEVDVSRAAVENGDVIRPD